MLITDGLRVLERFTRQPKEPPLSGLGPVLLAGSCVVAGAVAIGLRSPWPVWTGLFIFAFILAFRRK